MPRDVSLEIEDDYEEHDSRSALKPGDIAAVVSATDWTTETIVAQVTKGNIQLNPHFQRRDAWGIGRKSRLIESLIVGLPIPQIVLAEAKDGRGKFIVLDGKQRLLSIVQFWGQGTGQNNAFKLNGLSLRPDLNGQTYSSLSDDLSFEDDLNSLVNQSIRTVVIRNWKDDEFLHTVFLRLNTESVRLSPQELRQALLPGAFTDFVDQASGQSRGVRILLGTTDPDPRMRDTEIVARFFAFRFFAESYPGRMKSFLDMAFKTLNKTWSTVKPDVEQALENFDAGVMALQAIFGNKIARKPNSSQFNRAIFDALIYFHSDPKVRQALEKKEDQVRSAYEKLFEQSDFRMAVERDTAGALNTYKRLDLWAKALQKIAKTRVRISAPKIPVPQS